MGEDRGMSEAEAKAHCKRLAASHPDRATHRWLPRRAAEGWQVVKVGLKPPLENLTTEQRADERPSPGDDPRTAHDRNVGPWVGPG